MLGLILCSIWRRELRQVNIASLEVPFDVLSKAFASLDCGDDSRLYLNDWCPSLWRTRRIKIITLSVLVGHAADAISETRVRGWMSCSLSFLLWLIPFVLQIWIIIVLSSLKSGVGCSSSNSFFLWWCHCPELLNTESDSNLLLGEGWIEFAEGLECSIYCILSFLNNGDIVIFTVFFLFRISQTCDSDGTATGMVGINLVERSEKRIWDLLYGFCSLTLVASPPAFRREPQWRVGLGLILM